MENPPMSTPENQEDPRLKGLDPKVKEILASHLKSEVVAHTEGVLPVDLPTDKESPKPAAHLEKIPRRKRFRDGKMAAANDPLE